MKFKRSKDTQRITVHTLLEVKDHLKKRGIDIAIDFKIKAEEYLSQNVAVCEVCYAIAIAEHHLMNLEQQFAKAQSIPAKQHKVIIENYKRLVPLKSNLRTQFLFQWRILFHFKYLIGNDEYKVRFERIINAEEDLLLTIQVI